MGRVLLLAIASLLTVGCRVPPPRWPQDRDRLLSVEGPRTRVFHRDLDPRLVQQILPKLVAVREDVRKLLGCEPPRLEVMLYEARGVGGSSVVQETRADLVQEETGWVLGYAYPYRQTGATLDRLLGTTAHEVAEATVLLQVSVLDPYLRWMHDGIAELVEYEVLRRVRPRAARVTLDEGLEFLAAQRADGVRWGNLTRWRQLAGWIVRSHQFLGPGEGNLLLNDIPGSLARVRRALGRVKDPLYRRGLNELVTVLKGVRETQALPWVEEEARTEDSETRGLAFYKLSFAYWLGVERSSPGTLRRYMQALAARRLKDHVLTAVEGRALLEQAAQAAKLPSLERFTIDAAESILQAEKRRMGLTDRSP